MNITKNSPTTSPTRIQSFDFGVIVKDKNSQVIHNCSKISQESDFEDKTLSVEEPVSLNSVMGS
jgi:hypothetical protein